MTDVDNQKQDGRVRNWSWIVYPDSAPENWRSILDETG
ncbi:replication protein, partial [Streptococcus anginosus]